MNSLLLLLVVVASPPEVVCPPRPGDDALPWRAITCEIVEGMERAAGREWLMEPVEEEPA